MSSQSKQVVLSPSDLDTSAIKYMKPYVTKSGSKTISIISKQTNRALAISTPFMMTWGCTDFTDANGDSDGKFNISLNFPNDNEATDQTNMFLQKMKNFENQILDDAVKMSDTWWGKSMSREICEFTFFPMLKYSKNKETNKIDLTKPPSMRAKVPVYEGTWKVEIYNTRGELIFPLENTVETPESIITRLSHVACVLQSGGIWIGGKGWGITWKLLQCAIKPKEIISITGRCLIDLPKEESPVVVSSGQQEQPPSILEPMVVNRSNTVAVAVAVAAPAPVVVPLAATQAEDTDDEAEEEVAAPVVVETPPVVVNNEETVEEVVVSPPPPPVAAAVPVKKVIKKTVVAAPAPAPVEVVQPAEETPVVEGIKKKIVKKVVAASK
jgi:hypothetical protein